MKGEDSKKHPEQWIAGSTLTVSVGFGSKMYVKRGAPGLATGPV